MIKGRLDKGDLALAVEYLKRMRSIAPEHQELSALEQSLRDSQAARQTPEPSQKPAPAEVQIHALTVVTRPADARVRILNIGPRYQSGMQLPPGRYRLEITASGYHDQLRWITLEDKDLRVEVDLESVAVDVPPVVEPPSLACQRGEWNIQDVRVEKWGFAPGDVPEIRSRFENLKDCVGRDELTETAYRIVLDMRQRTSVPVVGLTVEKMENCPSRLIVSYKSAVGGLTLHHLGNAWEPTLDGFKARTDFEIIEKNASHPCDL